VTSWRQGFAIGLLIGLAAAARGQTMAYVLQADAFAPTRAAAVRKLAACDRDIVVIDASFDGGPGGAWTKAEIKAIRSGKAGRRVLAYLSIGEAEDYRAYWQAAWDSDANGVPDPGAPAFLGDENPDWPGNYRVRYWQPAWQAIVLSMLSGILAQGFDGAYLDIVDAFETWEYDSGTGDWIEQRLNPETGQTYRRDMVLWVRTIATAARQRRAGFLVFPQNGAALLRSRGFRNTVSGIGIEDLFTEGNKLQPVGHVDPILAELARLKALGKPVLLIEYGTRARARTASKSGAGANGFSLLLTDRALTTLGVCP
jgi:cysteinyl-tRNA synthetase